MDSGNYAAHGQWGDDMVEKERLLSFSDGYNPEVSVEALRRYAVSPQWIEVVAIALLLIVASCLLVNAQQLQLTSRVLMQYLNYADNRDLPRPDPYDGL